MNNLRIITDWFTQSDPHFSDYKAENVASKITPNIPNNVPGEIDTSESPYKSLKITIPKKDNDVITCSSNCYESSVKHYVDLNDKMESILNKIALHERELAEVDQQKGASSTVCDGSTDITDLIKQKDMCLQKMRVTLKENKVFSDINFSPERTRYSKNIGVLKKLNCEYSSIAEIVQQKAYLEFLLHREKNLKFDIKDYQDRISELKDKIAKIHPFFEENIDVLWDFNRVNSEYDFINRHHKKNIISYLRLIKTIYSIFAESQSILCPPFKDKDDIDIKKEIWRTAKKIRGLERERINRQPLFEEAVKEILMAYDSHKNSNDLIENMVYEQGIMQAQQQNYLASP